MMVFLSSLNPW